MSGLEAVRPENLTVQRGEVPPSAELAGLRAESEFWFFRLFIAAAHEGVDPKNVQSRDYPDDVVKIFTEGVQSWFQEWWADEEGARRVQVTDDARSIAERAYETYRASTH